MGSSSSKNLVAVAFPASMIKGDTVDGLTRVSEVILTNSTSKLLWAGNDSVTLHCSALGSAVHFSWSLNGRPLPRDPRYNITSGDSPPNSNLTINPVAKSDDGSFTCTVSNRLNNETSDSMILNLAWHPNGNILCRADQKDQNVQLGCSWPEGRPEAIVTLRFQNINLNGTSVVTSEVSPDNASSGTQLSCYGDQLGKTSNCTLQLERPQFTGTNNTDEKVEEGKTIELKVILVETGLPAKFAWFHYNPNRVPISSARSTRGFTVISTNFTSTLRIADANMEYNGKYECEAQNFIGKESFIFNVNVTKAVVPPPPPKGLDGGEIAGIVIGVLAGIALIGILVFFLVKRNKRKGESKGTVNEPEVSAGIPVYAQVNKQNNKQNGGAAETSLTNKPQDNIEDIKYATLNFLNQPSAKAPSPTTEETEYSQVKITNKR
ncbi:cell adhesion molecule CEACAM1-like [Gastrophryne carolinensis]